jgi:hypothetical protein
MLRTLASEDSSNTYLWVNQEYGLSFHFHVCSSIYLRRVDNDIGPLARIGPNHLLLSDPESIRRILAARSSYTRGPWYDALRIDPHRANLITERDERKHRVLRHQMAAGVSFIVEAHVHS